MSFYSVTKFSLVSLLNIMNQFRFTLEQHYLFIYLLEIYFQITNNCLEIARKYRAKFGLREGPTVTSIRVFIAKVRETGFIVATLRLSAFIRKYRICEISTCRRPQEPSISCNSFCYVALRSLIG